MINGHFGSSSKLFPLLGRCAFVLLLFHALTGGVACAQTQAFLEPMFVYDEPDIPTLYEPSLAAAWADTQAALQTCDRYGACHTAVNLHPNTNYGIQFDGIWAYYSFDLQTCPPNQACYISSNWGRIQTNTVCPGGGGAGYYGGSPNQARACAINLPFYPQPKNCPSCLGDPIYAGTGQTFETDTDYAGPTGLNYVRTYRSVPGRSASTASGSLTSTVSSGFIDYSSPGIATGFCYPGSWKIGNQSGNYCFPYIGVNKTQYQIATAAGTYITFSGSASAPAQNADINDRATQVNINGLTEWHVTRDDDTVETYNASGELLRKTLRGGRSFTYIYSDANTPSSIAPWPGLMLSESDPFGHTLSWQYNAQGFLSQMTDPAGSAYQFSYDATGNLSKVNYPDGTSKTYLYNESADTGGSNLPQALTGVVDENGVRVATFQYDTDGFAVGSMGAGGVDDFTFSYDSAAFYGSAVTSTVVTDPLGTQRTYTFQNSSSISYNYDSGETQPSASGSGSATQSFTRDSNANVSQKTDFNGEVTKYACAANHLMHDRMVA